MSKTYENPCAHIPEHFTLTDDQEQFLQDYLFEFTDFVNRHPLNGVVADIVAIALVPAAMPSIFDNLATEEDKMRLRIKSAAAYAVVRSGMFILEDVYGWIFQYDGQDDGSMEPIIASALNMTRDQNFDVRVSSNMALLFESLDDFKPRINHNAGPDENNICFDTKWLFGNSLEETFKMRLQIGMINPVYASFVKDLPIGFPYDEMSEFHLIKYPDD